MHAPVLGFSNAEAAFLIEPEIWWYGIVDPLFYLEFVEIASKSIHRRGFEKARTQRGDPGGSLRTGSSVWVSHSSALLAGFSLWRANEFTNKSH